MVKDTGDRILFDSNATDTMMPETTAVFDTQHQPVSSIPQVLNLTTKWNIGAILNCAGGSTLSLLTFLGQIMVFIVVAKTPRLQTPSNYFIISLAISDFTISIVCMPMWTVYHTLGYWPFSQLLCDLWHAIDFIVCTVTIFTIVFMSFDRYWSLRYPLTYAVKRTSLKAKMALFSIWVGATAVMGPFIMVTQNVYGKVRIPNDCPLYYLASVPLTVGECVLVLWGTVFATCLVYIKVFFLVQKAGKVSKTLTGARLSGKNKQQTSGEEDRQAKAFHTIVLLLVTFAICFLPASFILVVVTLKPGAISMWWLVGAYWVAYGNSFLNPLCYALGNPYFRETLGKLCQQCHGNGYAHDNITSVSHSMVTREISHKGQG